MIDRITRWLTRIMGLILFGYQVHKYNTNTLHEVLTVELFVAAFSAFLILKPSAIVLIFKKIITKKTNTGTNDE